MPRPLSLYSKDLSLREDILVQGHKEQWRKGSIPGLFLLNSCCELHREQELSPGWTWKPVDPLFLITWTVAWTSTLGPVLPRTSAALSYETLRWCNVPPLGNATAVEEIQQGPHSQPFSIFPEGDKYKSVPRLSGIIWLASLLPKYVIQPPHTLSTKISWSQSDIERFGLGEALDSPQNTENLLCLCLLLMGGDWTTAMAKSSV